MSVVRSCGGSLQQAFVSVRKVPQPLLEWISCVRCFSQESKAYLKSQKALFFSNSSREVIDLSFKRDEAFWKKILKSEKVQSVLSGRLEDCEEVREVTKEIVEKLLDSSVEKWEVSSHILYIVCCILNEKTHSLITNGQGKQLKDLIFAWVLPELMVAVKADNDRGSDYFSQFQTEFLKPFTDLVKCLEEEGALSDTVVETPADKDGALRKFFRRCILGRLASILKSISRLEG